MKEVFPGGMVKKLPGRYSPMGAKSNLQSNDWRGPLRNCEIGTRRVEDMRNLKGLAIKIGLDWACGDLLSISLGETPAKHISPGGTQRECVLPGTPI